MNELEMAFALGIILEPTNNKLDINNINTRNDLSRIVKVFNRVQSDKINFMNLSLNSMAENMPAYFLN
jgi:hypothetical protein